MRPTSRWRAASRPARSTTSSTARPTRRVVGLGFLAVRDTAAWLRWAPAASGNPCRGRDRARLPLRRVAERALPAPHALPRASTRTSRAAWSSTRSCRTWPAARRGEFNLRFGQPSLNAQESVGSLPPFTDETRRACHGQRDGLLARIAARARAADRRHQHLGRVLARRRLARSTPTSKAGATSSRRSSRAPISSPARSTRRARCRRSPADPNTGSRGLQRFNVVDYAPLLRAALVNLDRWVQRGRGAARRARIPRLADGTAVVGGVAAPRRSRRFPACAFPTASRGPRGSTSGPTSSAASPRATRRRSARRTGRYVSAVDADGNEVGGHPAWSRSRRRSRRSRAGTRAIPTRARRATSWR